MNAIAIKQKSFNIHFNLQNSAIPCKNINHNVGVPNNTLNNNIQS